MKTSSKNPDSRYGTVLETPTKFDRFLNWFEKITNYIWHYKFFIIAILMLIASNIVLLTDPKTPKWQFDHHTWPPLVVICFFSWIYGTWLKTKTVKILIMIVMSIICLNVTSYYFVSISIGILAGFIFRKFIKSLFLNFSK